MQDGRTAVEIPQHLSHGEKVRFLLELEPTFSDHEDELYWRELAGQRRCVRYEHLEVSRTPSAVITVKVCTLELEFPVEDMDQLVLVVDGLMAAAAG